MMFNRRRLFQLSASTAACAVFAPHVARAATRKLRIGHNNSPTSSPQLGSFEFKKYLLEKTDGRYDVEIYPNSQLGNDSQLVKAVSDGTLDMTISATAILGVYNRDLELAEIPYLFQDLTTARKALDGNLGAYYAELLEKSSLTVIGWGENGLRHVTANKPIRKVADLKGLKIRVQPAKIQVESFTGLGAAAEPLSFSELPEALRTGRFEAQENPIGILTSNDFLVKTQTHLSLTGHVYSPYAVSFSADVLEDMPAADRAIVKAAGALAAKATRNFSDRATATGLDQLKAAGMTIVNDVDQADFRQAMDGLSGRLAAVAGADAIARVRGLVA